MAHKPFVIGAAVDRTEIVQSDSATTLRAAHRKAARLAKRLAKQAVVGAIVLVRSPGNGCRIGKLDAAWVIVRPRFGAIHSVQTT